MSEADVASRPTSEEDKVWRRPYDDRPSPQQVEILRQMTSARRLQIAEQLFWFARDLKRAAIRSYHSDWADERVQSEVRRIFINARG
jgi:hypothetical protein